MTNRIQYLIRTASTMAALGLMTLCASAAPFKIDVPVEARWNNVVLPAGQYTVSQVPEMQALRVTGNGKAVTLLLTSTMPDDPNLTSHIKVITGGEVPVVSELTSRTTGTTYRFFVPKHAKEAPQESIALAKNSLH